MTAEITALIFDLDGTLIDTMPAHFAAWQKALAPYGVSLDRDFYYGMAGLPTVAVAEAILQKAGPGAQSRAEEIIRHKQAIFHDNMGAISVIGETAAIARKYAGKLPMAIATGSRLWLAEQLLRQTGLLELFPVILTADDAIKPKPAPDIFLEAARRLGQKAENCLVFEDGDPGLHGARDGGMFTIDVRTPVATWQTVLAKIEG